MLFPVYCDRKDNTHTSFLSLVPLRETTARILFHKLARELTAVGQTLINCIGLDSDEASSMVGGKNSV